MWIVAAKTTNQFGDIKWYLNRLWCPKKLYYIGTFSIQKLLWKDFYVIWWYFLPKIICANSIMQKSLNSRNWELSDLPHTIHNNLQIREFYIYKIHSCKMVMNSMIYFWQQTKSNICSSTKISDDSYENDIYYRLYGEEAAYIQFCRADF